ncbi:hypothetical protein Ae201684P_021940 [Aphanomyces euteiches]|nr:hypothetical protein Ae201684P_021940 [Aphanomyces euteiches]
MEAVSVPLKLPNAPLRPTNLLLKTLVWPTSCPSRSSSKSFDRREVVAFLGQVALETGNLQYVEQIEKGLHCQASAQYFCATMAAVPFGCRGTTTTGGSAATSTMSWTNLAGLPRQRISSTGPWNAAHPSNPDSVKVRLAGFRTFCKLLRGLSWQQYGAPNGSVWKEVADRIDC